MAKKYINADRMRAEVEKQRRNIEGLFTEGDNSFYDGQDDAYNHILAFIVWLQKQEYEVDWDKELDEEIGKTHITPTFDELETFARHFYELGLKARKGEQL